MPRIPDANKQKQAIADAVRKKLSFDSVISKGAKKPGTLVSQTAPTPVNVRSR